MSPWRVPTLHSLSRQVFPFLIHLTILLLLSCWVSAFSFLGTLQHLPAGTPSLLSCSYTQACCSPARQPTESLMPLLWSFSSQSFFHWKEGPYPDFRIGASLQSGMLARKCYPNSPDQITLHLIFWRETLWQKNFTSCIIHVSSLKGWEKQNKTFRLHSVLNFGRPGENKA